MSVRSHHIFTALCLTELAFVGVSDADPWQVSVRTLGLPERGDTDASTTQASPRRNPQQVFALALTSGDVDLAAEIAARAKDAGLARSLGWFHLNAGRPEPARDWFLRSVDIDPSVEAAYGATLAYMDLLDLDGAERTLPDAPNSDAELAGNINLLAARIEMRRSERALAVNDTSAARHHARAALERTPLAENEARLMLASIDLHDAERAYTEGNFQRARTLARAAAEQPQLTPAASAIEAWAALRSGDRQARRLFADLYRRAPNPEHAQGLMLAYDGDVDAPALRALAASASGPLYDLYDRRQAELSFARDDFITAARNDAYRERLAGSAVPWTQLTARANRRDGEAGRDFFEVSQTIWSLGGARGRDVFQADFAFARGEAGRPATATGIGTPGLPQLFSVTTDAETWAPIFSWRREGVLSPSVTLSASPIGGVVDAATAGSISLRHAGPRGQANGVLFARARGDSLLAASGLRDPATGATWGRIVEYGGEASMRRDYANRFSVSAMAALSTLEGVRTASNRRTRGSLSVSRNFAFAGFEYFAVGPFYGYEAYDENRNGFTFGNGGYFSPQKFQRVGIGLNLQTEEARRLVVRADAAIAYEAVEQDGLDVLPLQRADPFGIGVSTSSNGVSGALSVSVARLVTERVSIVGELATTRSAEFDSVQVGVALRYTFGDRASVVSRDLAQMPPGLTQ